jgi:hypothetical protein
MPRSRLGPRTVHLAWLAPVAAALALACGRPVNRPLDGAPPVSAGEVAAGRLVEPPPTLSVPGVTSGGPPSPVVAILASPSPSPTPALAGHNPILSGLLPAPDALVPAGPVSVGARIAGSTDLAEVGVVLDGAPVQPQITQQDARTWLVGYTGKLDIGKHEVRLNAKDREGRAGGYRWQFDVEPRANPTQQPAVQPATPTRAAPTPRP